jgi:hypothetical protein
MRASSGWLASARADDDTTSASATADAARATAVAAPRNARIKPPLR